MLYVLTHRSYSQTEGVLDGGADGVFSTLPSAHECMVDAVMETAGFYGEDEGVVEVAEYSATFETKNGYLIVYTIECFQTPRK